MLTTVLIPPGDLLQEVASTGLQETEAAGRAGGSRRQQDGHAERSQHGSGGVWREEVTTVLTMKAEL